MKCARLHQPTPRKKRSDSPAIRLFLCLKVRRRMGRMGRLGLQHDVVGSCGIKIGGIL